MDTAQDLRNKLQLLEGAGDHKGINDLLSNEVLQYYNDADFYMYKSSACTFSGDFAQALSYADRAVVLERGNKKTYYRRAFALVMVQEYEAAITDFNLVLKSVKDEHLFIGRATCWYKTGEYKKAVDDYSAAIIINDKNEGYYYERGLCKVNLFEYEAAIRDFDAAIAIKQDYYQAYCDRGLAFFYLDRFEEALKSYDQCLEINETYTVAEYNKGLLHHKGNNFDKAIESYTKAITNYGDPLLAYISSNAYTNRGNLYMTKQLYDRAFTDIDNALAINPAQTEAYLNRGIIQHQLSNYNKAKDDFVRAVGILQADEEANKTYLNFLEEQIKMCDEKISENATLQSVEATEADKKIFADTTKKLDELIDRISKAAKSDVKAVVHYTKLFVADIYLEKAAAKMNYSNAIYMNDPAEGKVLLHYMNNDDIESALENGEKLSELSVYLGSFLPAKDGDTEPGHNDELIMWRTYGRDGDGNEACGCSIIIDSKFFTPPLIMDKPVTGENADMLCKVIYIKDRELKQKSLSGKESVIEDAISEFKDQLLNLIKLKTSYDSLHAFYTMIDKMVYKKYSKIAYLFKSADYEYEHEVRVIKYVPRNSKTIKSYPTEKRGKPGKLYVESVNPVFPNIEKIYLGPKVHDSAYWSLYLDYQVKQRKNEFKLNKMINYISETKDIKIVKSERKFV